MKVLIWDYSRGTKTLTREIELVDGKVKFPDGRSRDLYTHEYRISNLMEGNIQQTLTPEDGELWLRNLPYNISGSYTRAELVDDIEKHGSKGQKGYSRYHPRTAGAGGGGGSLLNDQFIQKVDSNLKKRIRQNLSSKSIPQQYIDTVRETIKNEIENHGEIRIRVQEKVLNNILEDGEFKTQFETKTSRGLLDNEERARFENIVFGYDVGTRPSYRPIYGYVSDSKGESESLWQYGQVVISMKDDVKEYSTFTLADSLDNISRYSDDNILRPVKFGDVENYHLASPKVSTLTYHDVTFRELVGDYTEVQIHKPRLGVSDIKSVTFPNGALPSVEILDKLDKLGIEYKMRKIETWE